MFYFSNTRIPNFRAISTIDYDQYWRERGFAINNKLKEREEIILRDIPSGAKVLDIGCGNSLLPVKLKEKSCIVSIADVSSEVLKGYEAHGIKGLHLDLEKISAASIQGHYDYIILSEVLEHVTNPETVITVLKAHTERFALTVPNSAFYRYRFHLMFTGRFFTQWVYHPSEHVRFWSYIDFLDWLRALDLVIERTEASNGFSFFGLLNLKQIWKNLFAHQIVYIARV